MFKYRAWLLIIFLCCLFQVSRAQFDTQSPYSYYGIGTPVGNSLQNGFAMGGVSHALRDSCYINYLNPAAYSSLDVTTLIFGFEGNFLTRIDQGQTFRNNNVFINQFGLGIPIIHKHKFMNWGMFLGYAPYSQVGYRLADSATVIMNIDTTSNTADTMLARYRYTGTGGLNTLTWGNAFQLGKNFSIGFNLHYIFGTSSRIRTLELPADKGYLSSRVEEKTRVNSFSFDVGMQSFFNFKTKRYTLPRRSVTPAKKDTLGHIIIPKKVYILPDTMRGPITYKKYQFVIGGTYNFGNSFDAGFDQLGIQYLAGTFNTNVDTFLLNPTATGNITMPHAFGGGIALVNPGIWLLSADFNYKLWSGFRYFDQPNLVFTNSFSFHLGTEFTPYFSDKFTGKRRFFKNISYRFGVRYYNRFYRPDSKQVDEYGFSFGFGLPFGFNTSYDPDGNQKIIISYINLGVEGGLANSRGSSLVNESFVRFSISVTLRDKWFNKRYYN